MARLSVASGSPSDERHFHAIDGLRALAVAAVFYFHLSVFETPVQQQWLPMPYSEWGTFGVDLFFVISGFLITGILLKSRGATNYYRVFYTRRALRIFPLYYAVVAFVFLRDFLHGHTAPPFSTQIWFWLNLSNWPTAKAPLLVPQLTSFWTLAIEEQFYLLWPLLVRKLSNRTLLLMAAVSLPIEYGIRILPWIQAQNGLGNFTYRMTITHSEGLFVGAALAILIHDGVLQSRHVRAFTTAAIALLPLLLVVVYFRQVPVVYELRLTVLALLFGCVLGVIALRPKPGRMSRLLSSRPLRAVGRYSYCIYVIQFIVLLDTSRLFHYAHSRATFVLMCLLPVAITFAISALSWRFFEEPILSLKRHFKYDVPLR